LEVAGFMPTGIGPRVRDCRVRRGITQTELASLVGLSQKQVSRIERGQFVLVPRGTVIRIAEALEDPVVSGEVNQWLASLGLAPLVRSGIEAPPWLGEAIRAAEPVPTWCLDPTGSVVLCNRPARRLAGSPPHANILRLLLDPNSPIPGGWRDLLLRETLLWLANAPDEPWLGAWLADLPEARSGPGLPDVRPALEPFVVGVPMGWAPQSSDQAVPTLRFHLGVGRVSARPDLLMLRLFGADAETLAWCEEASRWDERSESVDQTG
jgi:transcriptional regulator with XRE-family HTH domain